MKSTTTFFEVTTRGKGLYDISAKVERSVRDANCGDGVATIFVCHTSASLVIFENADPTAARDLERYFERLVPEEAVGYEHTLEGPDDMTSHIRMALTRTSEVVPIAGGKLALGIWQGLYLFEHRRASHTRRIAVNVTGN